MIQHATGDIFDFAADAITNTVNCVGVMGKGVALAVRKKYPQILSAYKRACRTGIITPGSLWCYHTRDNTLIYNIATKDHWRDPSRYEWVESGLKKLALVLSQARNMTVVIPPLGCGCGGLDWTVVKPMVVGALTKYDRHNIIILEPQ